MIKASDGLNMTAYLTRPAGKAVPTPMVLLVHGGPWSRDAWGYDAEAQWLANRGYAVLQVNFRGSSGFGKAFLNAGNGQWSKKMQDDLTDAVHWAIDRHIAIKGKVAIFGASYGGYAVLTGLEKTPDLYACGVDVVGPSDLATLVRSFPSDWQLMRQRMLLRIGAVDTDDVLNRSLSPLYHVDKIKVPLLIAQGRHDPRVTIEQSEMIVKALKQKKIPVEYIVYDDEGHGFVRPSNRLDFYKKAEGFLNQCLT